MKISFKILLFYVLCAFAYDDVKAQKTPFSAIEQRTPEQDAAKLAEKLQNELSLTPEQTKMIYQINLKYSRARRKITNRNEAMQRIKNEEEEIYRVLNDEQKELLQNKRASRRQIEIGDNIRHTRTNPEARVTNRRYESARRIQSTSQKARLEGSINENPTGIRSSFNLSRSSERGSSSRKPSNSPRSSTNSDKNTNTGGRR